tara:strand:+ start:212 stop:601 length:390 start_codon:yes stop_codon:yes gene_type:complete
MSDKFTLEIISPEGTLLKVEASEVVIPSYEGEMGILKEHIPLITFLRPGLIKIEDNKKTSFFVEEGTVEFVNNKLLILSSTAKELSVIDQSSIQKQIIEAEKKISDDSLSDKKKYLLSYKINTLKNINQ